MDRDEWNWEGASFDFSIPGPDTGPDLGVKS